MSTSFMGLLGIVGTALVSLWAALRHVVLGGGELVAETAGMILDQVFSKKI